MENIEIRETYCQPYVLIETGKLPVIKETRGNKNKKPRMEVISNGSGIGCDSDFQEVELFKENITGFVYDKRMRFHSNNFDKHHHPEDPNRITTIKNTLEKAGCYKKMKHINAREATKQEICLAHTDEHWSLIKKTSALCSSLSAGGVIELCKAVVSGDVSNGFANVRPPGHHAGISNGTQQIFYNDPDVVYCSLHLYQNGSFYPNKKQADYMYVGGENALGKTINIPWPCPGMGDSEYLYAFNNVVMPIAYEFAPDIVLVSAGFDAAKGDTIGKNFVTPNGFAHMTHMLKSLANGKIVLALEGGYNLNSLSNCALACVKVLLGEPPGQLEKLKPRKECIEIIHQIIRTQSKYWKTLIPRYVNISEEKYEMMSLPLILDNKLNVEFSKSVCCSYNLFKKDVLFLFVHDMPEFRADTTAMSNLLNAYGSHMINTVYQYFDVIVKKKGYGIIDIDVPSLTINSETGIQELKDLLLYIWNKYIIMNLYQFKNIIIIGSGKGCQSLANFLSFIESLLCVLLIPGLTDVPSISNNCELIDWYNKISYVFLPSNHDYWNNEPKKECGNCINVDGK
ncbi:86_t:CDS:10 [Entrophospora sp. SA101]|nr:86_t:CDS:10 [Entrophospora sp. SA101]CAJ0875423.1 7569_t:CDS:10 [Entrophospora sp. SA101]